MEGNAIELMTSYTKVGKKPIYAQKTERKEASDLFGLDLTQKDGAVIKNDFSIDAIKDNFTPLQNKD